MQFYISGQGVEASSGRFCWSKDLKEQKEMARQVSEWKASRAENLTCKGPEASTAWLVQGTAGGQHAHEEGEERMWGGNGVRPCRPQGTLAVF